MAIRILVTLAIVQSAAILYLLYTIPELTSAVEAIGRQDNAATSTTVRPAETNAPVSNNVGLTEQQLRRIIAEELDAYLAGPADGGAENARQAMASSEDAGEIEDLTNRIEREIAYYKSVGSISSEQMVALQNEIMQLDRDSRQLMLRKLVQAMNAGQIDGQL